MLQYALASQFWRAIPAWLADCAWRRRGRRLLRQATRRIPAYANLLRVFTPSAPISGCRRTPVLQELPLLRTSWRSYVQVFPAEERGGHGWQRQVVAFDPLERADLPEGTWPRSRDEVRMLREQLVSLLTGWFDARQRSTLLLAHLPASGWCGNRRIVQVLQEAIGLRQLRASVIDLPADAGACESARRLAAQFEQCVLLCPATDATQQAQRVIGWSHKAGLVALGSMPQAQRIPWPTGLTVCSAWGIDEVGPLVGLETPLSRLVAGACQAQPALAETLLPGATLAGMYQPFPVGPWIEQDGSQLLLSSWGAAPVIRYRFGRTGRVIRFDRVCQLLRQYDVQSGREMRRLLRMGSVCWKLPLIVLAAE